ncbi:transcriptional repressor LexA [Streptomyces sp. NBC_01601]|uniref:transcriptional repressor LexA n=1 Tax=Streptomyces sp. NBC_01601 TaxID=2975892 RepID=UPI002E2DD014|nr:transcriptional repressor LexA [Streptomyces sp. NBC_01601]
MEAATTRHRGGRPPGIRPGDDGLTDRQRQICAYIASSIERRGYPPTLREIGKSVGLTSTSSVAHQLGALERKGFLRRDPRRPRTYVPTGAARRQAEPEAPQPEPGAVDIPLLGRIAAGTPILAEQEVIDVLTLPRQLVGAGELFALEVVGDSMIDAHIADGDQVVVRVQPDAETGDIVAAMIDGSATVKRMRKDGPETWLMPENRAHQPICGRDAVILGKVTAVMRRL